MRAGVVIGARTAGGGGAGGAAAGPGSALPCMTTALPAGVSVREALPVGAGGACEPAAVCGVAGGFTGAAGLAEGRVLGMNGDGFSMEGTAGGIGSTGATGGASDLAARCTGAVSTVRGVRAGGCVAVPGLRRPTTW